MSNPSVANPYEFPPGLPVPEDDGACNHLPGMAAPDVRLRGVDGKEWNLGELLRDKVLVYVYPATGVPGTDPIPGWDDIPGAPGCTVQSLGYRDHYDEFRAAGVEVIGISAQATTEQQEFAQRTQIPYLLLSDPTFKLRDTLRLPTFTAHGRTFYRRLALLFERGVIRRVFYPIFPPNENAAEVLAALT
ncbi:MULTISPECIES: peroxiredoxin [Sorangium]|uniref:peroxiredoxin n=1 Tax=Sorangium TaxID=39643 RepID=UPI003D9C0338